jgi:hypothetical protein
MKKGPSWEADSYLTGQEIPRNLWKLKVHYRVHKNLIFVLVLIQIDPIHPLTSYSFLSLVLIFFSRPRLCFRSGLLPSCFPTKFLIRCNSPMRSVLRAYPFYSPIFGTPNIVWWRVQIIKPFIKKLSQFSCHFLSLRPKYSPQHFILPSDGQIRFHYRKAMR